MVGVKGIKNLNPYLIVKGNTEGHVGFSTIMVVPFISYSDYEPKVIFS